MTDTDRPDPEELLARLQRDEEKSRRGRLKIFFGASPGVGKTFTMLEAAQALKQRGLEVIAGYVEPHERPATLTLTEGLEALPTRHLEYRGRALREFDLDAALQRRAALTLVDELAHTNVPGSRHAKRWQDVEELLAAGLDVWTTLNVQHLESLNDVVAQITGVRVRETLPDKVFESADEVELVDLPPDELLVRLQQGQVYVAEQAQRATQSFFRKGNLIALRELALRAMADRVDAQVRHYRDEHTIDRIWQVSERLMVCLGPGDNGEGLVRAGRRLAARLRVPWMVVYVETQALQRLPEAHRERLLKWLALAESMGADTASLSGQDIAATLLEQARAHNVTRLLVGKPRRRGLLGWQRSPLYRLAADAQDLDVIVVARDVGTGAGQEAGADSRGLDFQEPGARNRKRYLWATLVVAVVTALVWPLASVVAPTNLIMLYLLATVFISLRLGSGPSALSAVLSVLAFDFFFVPPHLTFAVSDGQYIITFAVMLVVGLLLSRLTSAQRAQARVAVARERRMHELHLLNRELARGMEAQYIAEVAVRHIATVFEASATLLLPDDEGHLHPPTGQPLPESLRTADLSVAQWVYDNEQPAGLGTQTLPGSGAHYLPLKALLRTRGVLAVKPRDVRVIQLPEQHRMLETFSTQIAITLERVHFAEVAQATELRMQTEQLRNHLLSAISHDLRTPLAGIIGSTSTLLSAVPLDEVRRHELLQGVHDEAVQMSELANNLLDMARLEAGALRIKQEGQPLEEVIGGTLNAMARRLERHPVHLDLPADLPWVNIDSVLMERVLANLLDNAVKYTPADTVIDIRARPQGDMLQLVIRDHGPGLPAGTDVFAKFTRGTPESSTPGVGLGLALCHAIVHSFGGTIAAHTADGGGAEFVIGLPIGQPPALPDELTILESTPP